MKRSFPIEKTMLDAMTTLLVLFAALFAIEAIQEKATKSNESMSIISPGKRITVELEWPPDSETDVDLWVRAPADVMPVGYSRNNDKSSSFERDDKGIANDLSAFNYEVTSIRNITSGIYVVNVHWFGNFGNMPNVPVKIRASMSSAAGSGSYVIASRELTLMLKGEEQTAFTFEIDSEGALVEGSVAHNYIPLRSEGK